MSSSTVPFRKPPRQRRGEQAVERVILAAESVIARWGFEKATTQQIAAAAGMSVGSIYRWFPDKDSIAEHLVRRYVSVVAAVAAAAFVDAADESTPVLAKSIFRRVAEQWMRLPAVASLMASSLGPLSSDSPGRELQRHLIELATVVVEQRVPGVPPDEAALTAGVCVSMLVGALFEGTGDRVEFLRRVDEAAYAAAAYLAIKYPVATSHRWTDPMEGLRPARTSLR